MNWHCDIDVGYLWELVLILPSPNLNSAIPSATDHNRTFTLLMHEVKNILYWLSMLSNGWCLTLVIVLKFHSFDSIIWACYENGKRIYLPAKAKDGTAHIILKHLLYYWRSLSLHTRIVNAEDQYITIPRRSSQHSIAKLLPGISILWLGAEEQLWYTVIELAINWCILVVNELRPLVVILLIELLLGLIIIKLLLVVVLLLLLSLPEKVGVWLLLSLLPGRHFKFDDFV